MNLHDTGPSSYCMGQHALETGTLREDAPSTPHEIQSTKRAFLSVIRSRADIGVHAFLVGRTVIGRNTTCTFPLHDLKVSGHHATITPERDGEYILEDMNSTNGTRVDGTAILGRTVLRDGDKILIGETVIRFSLADEFDIDFHSEVATLVGTDPLTGLPSKRRFDEALEFTLQNMVRRDTPLAVLMMDMDGVKQINDTHGHLYGAHVIGETGRLIAKVLGSTGQACRFGGDEFSAFLPGHQLDAACSIGEQIRKAVESAGFEKNGIALRPTISIGVSCYPNTPADSLSLITSADAALYRAKAKGKNCVTG
ncbi:GGDEF domain-containing protein [Novipirellula artificiosorum]|uniref:diguanylate cyclase n=1 Tax=Novipirellula artificiosorum TaxID=2528016 RepID=A0A5C6D9T5_9BACT|nr:GGDEF domain-containing protein [Novipirellula artificiosorum]TWU32467.1 Response regulator PleD [Novipirellula artificiosorum]